MKSDTQRAIMQLIDLVPQLNPILRESEIDNDEILPHLVLSDVIRWMTNHRADEHEACVTVIRWMEESYAAGSESVQELVVVSGVEMIPALGLPGSEFVAGCADHCGRPTPGCVIHVDESVKKLSGPPAAGWYPAPDGSAAVWWWDGWPGDILDVRTSERRRRVPQSD